MRQWFKRQGFKGIVTGKGRLKRPGLGHERRSPPVIMGKGKRGNFSTAPQNVNGERTNQNFLLSTLVTRARGGEKTLEL